MLIIIKVKSRYRKAHQIAKHKQNHLYSDEKKIDSPPQKNKNHQNPNPIFQRTSNNASYTNILKTKKPTNTQGQKRPPTKDNGNHK